MNPDDIEFDQTKLSALWKEIFENFNVSIPTTLEDEQLGTIKITEVSTKQDREPATIEEIEVERKKIQKEKDRLTKERKQIEEEKAQLAKEREELLALRKIMEEKELEKPENKVAVEALE